MKAAPPRTTASSTSPSPCQRASAARAQGTNPEQLFAAGYAACFESALRLVARLKKAPLTDAHITAKVGLHKTEAGAFKLSVDLVGKLEGLSPEDAKGLMEAAHQVCPYSNATRGNIDVTLALA